MLPYSAFMQSPQSQYGNQAAILGAAMPYMRPMQSQLAGPQIPTYGGPVSNAQQPSLQGPQIPQAGQGMQATNGVLSQVPMLMQYLQKMQGQNGGGSPVNNYFSELAGGQGNPSMYGGSSMWGSLFGNGANPYAGMGAPT